MFPKLMDCKSINSDFGFPGSTEATQEDLTSSKGQKFYQAAKFDEVGTLANHGLGCY